MLMPENERNEYLGPKWEAKKKKLMARFEPGDLYDIEIRKEGDNTAYIVRFMEGGYRAEQGRPTEEVITFGLPEDEEMRKVAILWNRIEAKNDLPRIRYTIYNAGPGATEDILFCGFVNYDDVRTLVRVREDFPHPRVLEVDGAFWLEKGMRDRVRKRTMPSLFNRQK